MSINKKKTAGNKTGELCPDCGCPTIWDEELVPVVTDIPDAEIVGLVEECPKCSWTQSREDERVETLSDLDSDSWEKCPICELASIIGGNCVECGGVFDPEKDSPVGCYSPQEAIAGKG